MTVDIQLVRDLEEVLEFARQGKINGLAGVFYYSDEEHASQSVAGGVIFHPCPGMRSSLNEPALAHSVAAGLIESKIAAWTKVSR